MTTIRYYLATIGAYWHNRPETLASCAKQALSFIEKLERLNPILFSNWRGGGNSKKEALRNIIPLTYEGIKGLIAENKKNQDEDYPEYCFDGGLWTAHAKDGEMAGVNFALGSKEKKMWSNNCLIDLPYLGSQYEYYCQPANRQALIQLLEEHWHPQEIILAYGEIEYP